MSAMVPAHHKPATTHGGQGMTHDAPGEGGYSSMRDWRSDEEVEGEPERCVLACVSSAPGVLASEPSRPPVGEPMRPACTPAPRCAMAASVHGVPVDTDDDVIAGMSGQSALGTCRRLSSTRGCIEPPSERSEACVDKKAP